MAKKEITEITAEYRAAQPYARDDYEPTFPRDSNTRRVLQFVTDEEDAFAVFGAGTAPRNTTPAIAAAMFQDENSPGVSSEDYDEACAQVQEELDALVEAGLVEQRDDGSYGLTKDGWVERSN
jgi:hypothetical protein